MINVFFFTGSYRHRKVAVNRNKLFGDDVTFATLANAEATGFLYCFRECWRDLVQRVEHGGAVGRMMDCESYFEQYPVPDVHDIPLEYRFGHVRHTLPFIVPRVF